MDIETATTQHQLGEDDGGLCQNICGAVTYVTAVTSLAGLAFATLGALNVPLVKLGDVILAKHNDTTYSENDLEGMVQKGFVGGAVFGAGIVAPFGLCALGMVGCAAIKACLRRLLGRH